MMRTTRMVGVAAVGIFALAACSPNESTSGKSEDVVINFTPFAAAAQVVIADDEGYFEDEGLSVELKPTTNPAELVPAVVGGSADVAAQNMFGALAASQNAEPLALVSLAERNPEKLAAVVSDDPKINGFEDLVGKSVGVALLNAPCDILAAKALEEAGVKGKIKWTIVPNPETAAALANGRVDAICAAEPFVTLAIDQTPGARIVADLFSEETGATDWPNGGYWTTQKWFCENKETAAKLREALGKASDKANADEAALRTTVQGFVPGLTKELADRMTLPEFNKGVDAAAIDRVSELLVDAGILKKPADSASMVDPKC